MHTLLLPNESQKITVFKSVRKMQQLGSMPNLKFSTLSKIRIPLGHQFWMRVSSPLFLPALCLVGDCMGQSEIKKKKYITKQQEIGLVVFILLEPRSGQERISSFEPKTPE